MALIESQTLVKPHSVKFFAGEDYELAINQLIQSLIDSLQNPTHDLSAYTSKFLELMQAKPEPVLETIWVFCGLTFHIDNTPKDDLLDQLSDIKDLFQYITGCSASCSPSICMSLIAPVIFKLYRVVEDSRRKELDSKRGKKARREIRSFLDVILGYLNVCCEGSNGDEDSGLIRPLTDLVSIWVHGEGIGDGVEKNGVTRFFPLLSGEIVDWITEEGRGDLRLLAGAVIVEAFLLKLCLKFSEGSSRQALQNELKTWAICSIAGFHDFYFFDMLVKMLLEPTLTVMSLLNPEDESFLRKMLYDIVILPDYSFLHRKKICHLPINHRKNNILARVIATHEAVELFRKNGDHTKAISYANAFSGSDLPSLLIELVTSELGTHGRASQPNGSSPTAFLKWMLDLEDQGLSLSDGFMSKHSARLVQCSSLRKLDAGKTDKDISFFIDNKGNNEDEKINDSMNTESSLHKLDAGKTDTDLLFFIDNKGGNEDEKINDSMNDELVAAAHTIQLTNGSGKKRKEKSAEKDKDGFKYRRYNFADHSGSKFGKKTGYEDGSGSASEVEDPDSGEDLE